MKKFQQILGIIFGLVLVQNVSAQSVKQILQHYYPKYHNENQCFIGKSLRYYDGNSPVYGDYCLKIDAQKIVNTAQGKMQYILLAGDVYDVQTDSLTGAHVDSGAVGMLVLKSVGGNDWQVQAVKTGIAVGAFGSAPTGWTLHQFGPDQWGFLNSAGDAHQGYSGSRYVIFLPSGKTIHDSWITGEFDNEGVLNDCSAESGITSPAERADCLNRRTSLNTTILIDRNAPLSGGMHPLRLTVNGYKGKKTYRNHVVVIPFDPKKGLYLEPENSPLSGADF